MTVTTAPATLDAREGATRLARTGGITAVSDALFSSILVIVAYGSTFSGLWQGVASTLLGKAAFDGGARKVAIGLAMHTGVAFAWSAFFIFVVLRSAQVRAILASRLGTLKIAALYGPFIWLVMSVAVIPPLVHHMPAFAFRWWVQLVGHIPFVALPIVMVGSRRANGE